AGEVVLLVNRSGPGAGYVMPDLIGIDGARAADLLRAKGFRVAVVGSTPYPGTPAGGVLRQSPQAGYEIDPAQPISLSVSRWACRSRRRFSRLTLPRWATPSEPSSEAAPI